MPLPAELRHGKVAVTATLQAARETDPGESQEQLERRNEVLQALKRLRARGTFREITDSVTWQREIRQDRPLSGGATKATSDVVALQNQPFR
jgi:hypothetical protein